MLLPVIRVLLNSLSITRTILILCLFLPCAAAFAQEALWGKSLDSHRSCVVSETRVEPDGDVVLFGYYSGTMTVGGRTLDHSDDNIGSFIIRLSNGGFVKDVFAVEGKDVYIENASIDSNGDFIVVGRMYDVIEFDGQQYDDQSTSASLSSSFVAKYRNDGTPLWIKIFSNSSYTNVDVDEHDNIYVLSYESMDFRHNASYLRKYAPNGLLLFENKFLNESEAESYPRCLDVRNGEIIVGGMVYSSGTIFGTLTYTGSWMGFYMARFGVDGNLTWARKIGETTYNNADFSDVMIEDDGSFYITGGLSSNMVLARYDQNGTLMWSKKSLPQSFTSGYFCKGPDGSLFLATNFYDKAELDGHVFTATPDSWWVKNAPNIALIKLDPSGNVLGIQEFEPYIVNLAISVSSSASNEIYIGGMTDVPTLRVGSVSITLPDDTPENLVDGFVVRFDGDTPDAPIFQIITSDVCFTDVANFHTSFNPSEIKNVSWNFGDAASGIQNTTNGLSPAHHYALPGIYKVTSTVTDIHDNQWRSSQILEIHDSPRISLGPDFSLCAGATDRLDITTTETNLHYSWQDGSMDSYLNIGAPGKYWVTATNQFCESSDSVTVVVAPLPKSIQIDDRTLCPGDTYSIDLSNADGSIYWTDGFTEPIRDIVIAGSYTVTSTNDCGSVSESFTVESIAPLSLFIEDATICRGKEYHVDLNDVPANLTWNDGGHEGIKDFLENGNYTVMATNVCETTSASFRVSVIEPFKIDLGKDRYMCDRTRPVLLEANVANAEYLWSNGSTSNNLLVTEPGTYWLEVTNACHTVSDSVSVTGALPAELTVPNVITPNGDLTNEYFELNPAMLGTSLNIFNRWGNEVYSSDKYDNRWNGDGLESAVYFYTIPDFCIKGWVQIIR